MGNSRAGLASHLAVGALALVAGAGLTSLLRRPHLDPVTTHGEWVYIKKPAGDSLRAYVAYPERKDKAPAIIVIHEIFGLTDWEPTVGDRLAGKGYVAIVPDLLSSRWGQSPASGDSGRKLMAQLVPDQVTADLDAAYGYVNGLPSVKKDRTGVMGFCWGGGQTFRYATNNPKLKAAVVCYGPNPDTLALERIKAPILGVYGEADARINSMLPTVSRIMSQLGKPFVADSYPGTGHGFLKPGRKGSDTDQVDKAWAKIDGFFTEKLK
ncbi:MAG: dienelactone hydrolase family protein [Gemmatimonadota bacterium]